jgi:3-oxoacyl-[acyl-carrier protein] reductase
VTPPVTLITGASKGLGYHLAEHCLAKGHQVIGVSRGAGSLLHERYAHFELDVVDESGVLDLFKTVRRTWGGLDHLINNAGTASMNHALLTPMAAVRRILATNVEGVFLLSREAAKLMRARGGRIVNLTSVAVPLKLEGEAIYAASKAAVISLTEVLARELAPMRITVNAVGPGPIATDLIRGVPEQKIKEIVARQAVKRMAEPRDVAHVVDFFLSRESEMITGQTVFLGGV